jgi:hypothetical protein
MAAISRSPRLSDWRDIARLGEQIVNAASLAEQRDHIVAMTSLLVKGEIEVWLCESVFRLPSLPEEDVFPEEPELQGMKRAIRARQARTKQRTCEAHRSHAPPETWAAVPIIERGFCWERFRSRARS